jgi:hypothetical protein
MGDPEAQNSREATQDILKAYNQYLPSLMYNTSKQVGSTEMASQRGKEMVSPRQQALAASLFTKYSPYYAGTQAQEYANVAPIYNQAAAASERDTLQGAGGELLRTGEALNREIDPEFYNTRASASNGLETLIGEATGNLNGDLSPSEMAQIERGLNRMGHNRGIGGLPLGQNTLRASNLFGAASENKLNQRRSNLTNAINSATAFLPNSRSGTNAFQDGTGKAGAASLASWGTGGKNIFGNSEMTGGQGFGSNAWNLGNAFLGGTNALQMNAQDINANRRDTQDRVTEVFGAIL